LIFPHRIDYHIISFLADLTQSNELEMNSINDKWLTIDELAAYLKMGRTKLYTLSQKGEIPGNKIGSQWRFDREEIDAWIKSGRAEKRRKRIDRS